MGNILVIARDEGAGQWGRVSVVIKGQKRELCYNEIFRLDCVNINTPIVILCYNFQGVSIKKEKKRGKKHMGSLVNISCNYI